MIEYTGTSDLDRRLRRLANVMDLPALVASPPTVPTIKSYYVKSRLGYLLLHSHEGAIHMALNPDGKYSPDGYLGQARLIGQVIERVGARSVLELASGRGFNVRHLARLYPDVSFSGIDLLDAHVRDARRRSSSLTNVTYAVGDFQDTPFPDGSFDLVFAVESLCHATDIRQLFNEIRRIARPGGTLVVIDEWRGRPESDLSETELLAATAVERSMAVPLALTVGDWLQAVSERGFAHVETRDLTEQITPNLVHLESMAAAYLARPRVGWLLRHLLPTQLMNNVAAGYLMPSTVAHRIHQYLSVELRVAPQ